MTTQTASLMIHSKVTKPIPESKVHGRLITTKVVGVTFESRQEVVAKLQMGDRVWLEPELDNPFDPNAVMVTRNNGEQFGYLNRYLAANLAPYFEKHKGPIRGKVNFLTGSSDDGYSLGVVISFKVPKQNQSKRSGWRQQFDEWDD